MRNIFTIQELLIIVRQMYKNESDPNIKQLYLNFGLAIKNLIDCNELTYFDDFNKKETRDKIFGNVLFIKGGN